MEQIALAIVEDTPDVLKARLRQEWEAIEARKQAGLVDYDAPQAEALIMYRNLGLTQREIATCLGLNAGWVDQLMRYGRFLECSPAQAIRMPEYRFRRYWRATADHTHLCVLRGKKNESARLAYEQHVFQAIVEHHIQGEDPSSEQYQGQHRATRQLTKQIVAQFSDGKFHLLRDIATAVGADMVAIRSLCDRIVTHGTLKTFGERRPAPPAQGSFAYRFVKGGTKKLNLSAFYAEVKPVLDDMENVINGHSVDFSQQAMKIAFAQFRKVIDRVAR